MDMRKTANNIPGLWDAHQRHFRNGAEALYETVQDAIANDSGVVKVFVSDDRLAVVSDGDGLPSNKNESLECWIGGMRTSSLTISDTTAGRFSWNGVGTVAGFKRLMSDQVVILSINKNTGVKHKLVLTQEFHNKNIQLDDKLIEDWNDDDHKLAESYGLQESGVYINHPSEPVNIDLLATDIARRLYCHLDSCKTYINNNRVIGNAPIQHNDKDTVVILDHKRYIYPPNNQEFFVSYALKFDGSGEDSCVFVEMDGRIVADRPSQYVADNEQELRRGLYNAQNQRFGHNKRRKEFPLSGKSSTSGRARLVLHLNNNFDQLVPVPPTSRNTSVDTNFMLFVLSRPEILDAYRSTINLWTATGDKTSTVQELLDNKHTQQLIDLTCDDKMCDKLRSILTRIKQMKINKANQRKKNKNIDTDTNNHKTNDFTPLPNPSGGKKAFTAGMQLENKIEELLNKYNIPYHKQLPLESKEGRYALQNGGGYGYEVVDATSTVDFALPIHGWIIEARRQDSPGTTREKDTDLILSRGAITDDKYHTVLIVYEGSQMTSEHIAKMRCRGNMLRYKPDVYLDELNDLQANKKVDYCCVDSFSQRLEQLIETQKTAATFDNLEGDHWNKT
jgi:hypothetical protein